ncbi:unnamed protein product [Protopolystoma xenopodis]|uniref:Uncharacterized protein n=1 Tax=Protopolystoma xenopodis TaxID=117903 RepID=A0A448WLZ8_9PLAT|nr:unnamed protein product [Protopolystoma xenopodis]
MNSCFFYVHRIPNREDFDDQAFLSAGLTLPLDTVLTRFRNQGGAKLRSAATAAALLASTPRLNLKNSLSIALSPSGFGLGQEDSSGPSATTMSASTGSRIIDGDFSPNGSELLIPASSSGIDITSACVDHLMSILAETEGEIDLSTWEVGIPTVSQPYIEAMVSNFPMHSQPTIGGPANVAVSLSQQSQLGFSSTRQQSGMIQAVAVAASSPLSGAASGNPNTRSRQVSHRSSASKVLAGHHRDGPGSVQWLDVAERAIAPVLSGNNFRRNDGVEIATVSGGCFEQADVLATDGCSDFGHSDSSSAHKSSLSGTFLTPNNRFTTPTPPLLPSPSIPFTLARQYYFAIQTDRLVMGRRFSVSRVDRYVCCFLHFQN